MARTALGTVGKLPNKRYAVLSQIFECNGRVQLIRNTSYAATHGCKRREQLGYSTDVKEGVGRGQESLLEEFKRSLPCKGVGGSMANTPTRGNRICKGPGVARQSDAKDRKEASVEGGADARG